MDIGSNRNNTIDVLRLVFAVLVVSIHTMALYCFGEDAWLATSMGVARIAVPFFFIITGYFFYPKVKKGKSGNTYIKKIFKFYITWVLIEAITLFPLLISDSIQELISTLIGVLLIGVTGSLWYLSSMILALLVTKQLLKKDKFILLFIVSSILFIIGLSGDSYYGLTEGSILGDIANAYANIFKMTNIGFTCSVPFIVIGAAINKYKLKDKIKNSGIISLIGIGLLLIETFVLYKNGIAKDCNMLVSLLVVVPAIFIWALNSKLNISNKSAKICREYSIGIYCTHQILMMHCFMLVGGLMQNTLLRFLITLGVATLTTFILRKFRVTRKYLLLSNEISMKSDTILDV